MKIFVRRVVPRLAATVIALAGLISLASAAAPRIDYVEPATASAGSTVYRLLHGKGLNDSKISGARVVPANSVKDVSISATIDGSSTNASQRGVKFTLPPDASPGPYFIQLTGSGAQVLASSAIYVSNGSVSTTSVSPQTADPRLTPYTYCENGNLTGAAGALGNPRSKVYCSYSLMSKDEVRDNYGSRIAATYYAIQVGISNSDPQYDYLLRSIVLTLPDGRRVASRVKRFAQGVAVEGRIHDNCNLAYNLLTWGGSVFGGLTIFEFAATNAKNVANLFQGSFLTGFNTTFPDVSVDNVNRFNNAVFDDQQAMVVPKAGVAQPSVFLMALVPRLKGSRAEEPYIQRYGEQVNVSVDGTAIQAVNLIAVSKSALDFGTQPLKTSSTQTFSISNNNQVPVSTTITVPSDFSAKMQTSDAATGAANTACSANAIPAGATCSVEVTFTPSQEGSYPNLNLVVDGNFSQAPLQVSLKAIGSAFSIDKTTINFSNQPVGQPAAVQTVTVTNVRTAGAASLPVIVGAPAGNDAADFSVDSASTTCSSSSQLVPQGTCKIGLVFTPHAAIARGGQIQVTVGSAAPQTILLAGTGVKVTPSGASTPSGAANSASFDAIPAFNYTITGAGGVTPTGSVSYTVDSNTAQTVPLSATAAGAASAAASGIELDPRQLTAGQHTIRANYSGDPNYNGFSLQDVAITIAPGAAADIVAQPVTATSQINTAYAVTLTIKDKGGNTVTSFTGTVNVACAHDAAMNTAIVFAATDNGVKTVPLTPTVAGSNVIVFSSTAGGKPISRSLTTTTTQ